MVDNYNSDNGQSQTGQIQAPIAQSQQPLPFGPTGLQPMTTCYLSAGDGSEFTAPNPEHK